MLAGGYGLEARGEGLPALRAHAEPEVRPPILMAPSRTEVEHVETRPVMLEDRTLAEAAKARRVRPHS